MECYGDLLDSPHAISFPCGQFFVALEITWVDSAVQFFDRGLEVADAFL
jgi:hypothetical protein